MVTYNSKWFIRLMIFANTMKCHFRFAEMITKKVELQKKKKNFKDKFWNCMVFLYINLKIIVKLFTQHYEITIMKNVEVTSYELKALFSWHLKITSQRTWMHIYAWFSDP